MKTGNDMMDKFFKTHFQPDTGMWVRATPRDTEVGISLQKYYKTS